MEGETLLNSKPSRNGHHFDLALVTPEGSKVQTAVEMVEFPTSVGELGIFPGHIPMLVDLAPGELRIHRNGEVESFVVAGGFVQVHPVLVRVVASFATSGVGEDEIEAACQRAKAAIEQAAGEDPALIAASLADFRTELSRTRHIDVRRHRPPNRK